MKRVNLIINGAPRVGKDTVTNTLRNLARLHEARFDFVSSIEPVKDVLRNAGFPVDRKDGKERKLLSQAGDAFEEYNGFKSQNLIQKMHAFHLGTARSLFVTHIREPEMIEKIKADPRLASSTETKTLLVASKIYGEKNASNAADANVANYVYDFYLDNDGGLIDLEVSVAGLYNLLMLSK